MKGAVGPKEVPLRCRVCGHRWSHHVWWTQRDLSDAFSSCERCGWIRRMNIGPVAEVAPGVWAPDPKAWSR